MDINIQTSPRPKKEAGLREWSSRLFFISLAMGACSFVVTQAGLNALGAGHGSATIWYCSVLLWFATWLMLVGSCVTGLLDWRRSRHFPFWIIPGLVLLFPYGYAWGQWVWRFVVYK